MNIQNKYPYTTIRNKCVYFCTFTNNINNVHLCIIFGHIFTCILFMYKRGISLSHDGIASFCLCVLLLFGALFLVLLVGFKPRTLILPGKLCN